MSLFTLDKSTPEFTETTFIAPNASLIGRIRIGEYSSIWFNTVLRGDMEHISIGEETNIQDLSMGHADQVKQVTGFTIGGVSPIGHLNPIKIYIDQSLSRFENIFGAAGHPNCVFKINFIDLQKITSGEVMDIAE